MPKIKKFGAKTKAKLNYYVYVLTVKERKKEIIFYVGKGIGNRVFEHFKKANKIDIESLGDTLLTDKEHIIKNNECNAYIVDAGMTSVEALSKEALLINLLRDFPTSSLTNIVKGNKEFGIRRVEEIEENYAQPINLEEFCKKNKIKVLTLKSDEESYTNSRYKDSRGILEGIWNLDKKKLYEVDFVLGIRNRIIYGVYEFIKGSDEKIGDSLKNKDKWDRWNQIHSNLGRPKRYLINTDKNADKRQSSKVVISLKPVSISKTQNVLPSDNVSQIKKKIADQLINRTVKGYKIGGANGKYYFGLDK